MSKFKLIPNGVCRCRICEKDYNLEGKESEIETCLCGTTSVDNGKLIDTDVEVIWNCTGCGFKNKDIKRFEIQSEK